MQQTLAEINAILQAKQLRPLDDLGDWENGREQIVEILEIYEHSSGVFTDIKFSTIRPNGAPGFCTSRFNANTFDGNGAVLVMWVNRKYFAIVQQWRLACGGRYTYEVPRGFRDPNDPSALFTARRELYEEVMAKGKIERVTPLGDGPVAEFTGTHNVWSNHFLIEVTIPEAELPLTRGAEAGITVHFWTKKKVKQEFGRLICDNFSLAAFCLAFDHIDHRCRTWWMIPFRRAWSAFVRSFL